MKYKQVINGIEVNAFFSDESVEKIFLPLLRHLTEMQKEKGKRILVMLAAPPGAGKSTLCSFLQYLASITEEIAPVTVIGMDGFHRYQDDLISHTTLRDGKEISMAAIKGAPVTFNLEKMKSKLEEIVTGKDCGYPEYNRAIHNPVEDAIQVTGNMIFMEGNYLLLNQDGWNTIRNYADYTIFLGGDEKVLRKRLIDRRVQSGTPLKQAEEFVEYSDLENVRVVLNESGEADLILDISQFTR